MRINRRWNKKGRARTIPQMANALAAAIWKLSSQALLNLENENFETTTQGQRLDILAEIAIYLLHQCDRRVYELTTAENRNTFISALAIDLARMIEDSRVDVQGVDSYQAKFIETLNARTEVYSESKFSAEDGAGFAMRCAFGNFVQQAMGARDNKWIPDYILGREAPAAEISLRNVLPGLVDFNNLSEA